MLRSLFILILSTVFAFTSSAQGTLTGVITDKATNEGLIGATVLLIGTYKGAATDFNGKYTITGIKPGDYSVRVSYVGYKEKIFNGIHITKDGTVTLTTSLAEQTNELESVEVIGEKPSVDLESGKSEVRISKEDIKEMNVRNVQDVAAMQAGVNKSPDGLQIRGGRVYETQYLVDGINAADPLAGTGFGTDVASGSVQDITVMTGGGDAEYNSNSGTIVTRIREGGDKFSIGGRWQRDNLGFNQLKGTSWNTDLAELSIGTPIPGTNKKLTLFTSLNVGFTSDYFGFYAKQLNSSLMNNKAFWAPRQDNSWSNTFKLAYQLGSSTRITFTNQHSIAINQNSRTLQIIGFDQIMVPGFQYAYTEQMDNASTYTHRSNLSAINVRHSINKQWKLDATAGRLFTRLRADANGRVFRDPTLNQVYDPESIITNPVTVFDDPRATSDSVLYALPGNGFYNNGGISTLWHDHYFVEYTLKAKATWLSDSKIHFASFGFEHKVQEMQWIDVTRPWVGAPIKLNDGTYTPSSRIGQSNDVWAVKPHNGALYAQDEIKYKGIIAVIGGRFEYWAPGKFADEAVDNPYTFIAQTNRDEYKKQTAKFLGLRWKARLLPKLRVSFPVTENNVLYFNYGHSLRLPHPRFMYAGLDTNYQNRVAGANAGNPNLNPEVAVSYELGVKSQITKDFSATFTAFYKDQFDFIVNRTAEIIDPRLGQEYVDRVISINQDYARVRGVELGLNYRLSKQIRTTFNGSYQVATGKSNSAKESLLQIRQTGQVNTTKEQYLAWDRPWDLKGSIIYTPDTNVRIFNIPLKGFRFFFFTTWKSGLRYTPYRAAGKNDLGRTIYELIPNSQYSKIGSSWFWSDISISRDFVIAKKAKVSFSIEIKNIFNNKNAQIVNPVTGTAYREGDALPFEQRDPNYVDPNTSGLPPSNPARYLQPTQIIYGIGFNF
ncbi:MAG TPA: TonB-dependent receptor [Catalimonadaceae bacterium]|nr:TonB-dependent receptor [Catalimonadaceae bacterium]